MAKKAFTLRLDESLIKRIKVHCIMEGLAVNEVVEKLLTEYLSKQAAAEKKPQKPSK